VRARQFFEVNIFIVYFQYVQQIESYFSEVKANSIPQSLLHFSMVLWTRFSRQEPRVLLYQLPLETKHLVPDLWRTRIDKNDEENRKDRSAHGGADFSAARRFLGSL
jgi:hypothetical protein